MEEKSRTLVQKFIENRLSEQETESLKAWMEDPRNREELKREVQLHFLLQVHFKRYDAKKAFTRSKAREASGPTKGRTIPLRSLWKYAAILVVVLGLGYYFTNQMGSAPETLDIPDETITLDLGDGTQKDLKGKGTQVITDHGGATVGRQVGDTLRYDHVLPRAVAQHTLKVPYGKTHKLVLSDGTYVHLNAGSTLTYPSRFEEGERRVALTGEAYFEVAHEASRPFLVNAREIAIQVHGTRFNVSAYPEDGEVATTLLEGSVGLRVGQRAEQRLVPGEMGRWDKTAGTLDIQAVETDDQIAWIKGRLIFHSKPFKDILLVLERKYNVQIENRYPELDGGRYRGTFGSETIEEVLHTFTESRLFDYHIENNTVIINKPDSL